MFWYANSFWLFILVIVLAGIVSNIIRGHQREKTIRAAIEKGVTLDPETLRSVNHVNGSPRFGFRVAAIITFFVGVGLLVLAYFAGHDGEPIRPMMGVTGLMWCISLGLFVSSFFAPKTGD